MFVSACRRSHWCSFYSSVWVQPQNHPQVWIGHDSNSPLVDSNAGCILTCRLHFHFTSLPPFSARCGYDATRPLQNTLGLQRGVGRRQPETRHQPDAAQRRQPHQLWTDTAALQHHRDDGIGSHSVFVLFFSPLYLLQRSSGKRSLQSRPPRRSLWALVSVECWCDSCTTAVDVTSSQEGLFLFISLRSVSTSVCSWFDFFFFFDIDVISNQNDCGKQLQL